LNRIVLGIEYDGASWEGWQTQPHKNTIQDCLQSAIFNFCNQKIFIVCAGRTDAGVHAIEQIVHFDTDLIRDLSSWIRGVNVFLPSSIIIKWAAYPFMFDSDKIFHARFSAISRTYIYLIFNDRIRSVFWEKKAVWVFKNLDLEKMQIASQCLLGIHDFSAFRSSECQSKTPIREMKKIKIYKKGDIIFLEFCANAFLHHMLRNIVGSLVQVGSGKQSEEWIYEILIGKDRKNAAPTFSPYGLYLFKIEYDKRWALPQLQKKIIY